MNAGWRRHWRVIAYMAGSLRRRWRKNLAICVVYAFMVFILASVVFLTQALTREGCSTLRAAPEIMVQRLNGGRHGLIPIADAASLSGIAGVRSVHARRWAYHPDPVTGALLLVRVPTGTRLQGMEAAAGGDLLRRHGIAVGGTLPLRNPAGKAVALRVTGIAETVSPLESAALVEVSEAAFQDLTGMPADAATDLVIHVANEREIRTVAAKVGDHRPDTRTILREELARTYGSVFHRRSGVIIAALLVPVMAFILFAWDKAMGMSPDERREIGILKAIGWETSDVVLLKSYEALAVSIAAFAAGCCLAIFIPAFSRPYAMMHPLLGWSALYPPFPPDVVPGAYETATLFFLVVFPYMVATVIPAWRAATMDPDLVMRGSR